MVPDVVSMLKHVIVCNTHRKLSSPHRQPVHANHCVQLIPRDIIRNVALSRHHSTQAASQGVHVNDAEIVDHGQIDTDTTELDMDEFSTLRRLDGIP